MSVDYSRVVNYIKKCSHIHGWAEKAQQDEKCSVWCVGREVDYDSYEDMRDLEESIGLVRLSRFLKELEKEIWLTEKEAGGGK